MSLGESRRRSLLVLAAGLVLAGGLAACTDGEGAEPEPTKAATSAAPSGEPTAERPEVEKPVPPDAMARDDVAGAEAAAQYFLELYPYVYATGDLTEWNSMSDPECVFCSSVIDEVDQLHAGGGGSTGGEVEIESTQGFNKLEGNEYFRVDVLVNHAPSTKTDENGDVSKSEPGGRNLLIFALGKADEQWIVRAVQVEAPDYEVETNA